MSAAGTVFGLASQTITNVAEPDEVQMVGDKPQNVVIDQIENATPPE